MRGTVPTPSFFTVLLRAHYTPHRPTPTLLLLLSPGYSLGCAQASLFPNLHPEYPFVFHHGGLTFRITVPRSLRLRCMPEVRRARETSVVPVFYKTDDFRSVDPSVESGEGAIRLRNNGCVQ